jgi:hypothetical protein
MQLIRTAFDSGVDHSARGASILGAVVIGSHFKLRQGIRIGLNDLVRKALVAGAVGIVIDTIRQKIIQFAALSVNVERGITIVIGLIFERRLGHARHQQRQIGIGSTVQRKIRDLLRVNDLPAAAAVGFEQDGRIADGDIL